MRRANREIKSICSTQVFSPFHFYSPHFHSAQTSYFHSAKSEHFNWAGHFHILADISHFSCSHLFYKVFHKREVPSRFDQFLSVPLSPFEVFFGFSKWPSLLRFKLIMFFCHRHFQPTSSQLCNFSKSSNFLQNSWSVWCLDTNTTRSKMKY